MNTSRSRIWRRRLRILRGTAAVLIVLFGTSLGYAVREYVTWRDSMIAWDRGTIELRCGGTTEQDRLLAFEFLGEWEYRVLKRTSDGRQVWLHWKLTKRHCGNWMLIDGYEPGLIRPFDVRFPDGAPPRQSYSCVGIPVDEAAKIRHLEEVTRRIREEGRLRTSG